MSFLEKETEGYGIKTLCFSVLIFRQKKNHVDAFGVNTSTWR